MITTSWYSARNILKLHTAISILHINMMKVSLSLISGSGSYRSPLLHSVVGQTTSLCSPVSFSEEDGGCLRTWRRRKRLNRGDKALTTDWIRSVFYTLNLALFWMTKSKEMRRYSRGWDDNIRIDLREIECEAVDWIPLALERDQLWAFVNRMMEFWFR
jgi:hypothetical protein